MVDEALVERITRQVMEELRSPGEASSSKTAGVDDDGSTPSGEARDQAPSVLAVITPGPADLGRVRQELNRLAENGVVVNLFLDRALPEAERSRFRTLSGSGEVHEAAIPDSGCYTLVTGCDAVILPTLSMDTLDRIAELDPEDTAGRIAVEALSDGKEVWAPNDTLVDANRSSQKFQRRVDQAFEKARELGVRSAPLHDMGVEFLDVAGRSGELTEVTVCRDEPDPESGEGLQVKREGNEVSTVFQTESARIGTTIGVRDVRDEVAGYIDHTLLNPEATREDIVQLCEEARKYNFASVCVNPTWVPLCDELLQGTSVKVCTVVGFPLGATTTATKVQETREAIANGADEIDMVMNVGALKEGDFDYVREDVASVKEACGDRVLKVILETGLLSDQQKMSACRLCKEAGADYVKTSTGFGPGGATMSDIALMRRVVGSGLGVKASGGVGDFDDAVDMIAAGANRIGASAGIAIVSGEESESDY